MEKFTLSYSFEKSDATGRYVRGWATVCSVDGQPVEDWQGDVVSIPDITKAAHEFVKNCRVGKAMHKGAQVADLIESVIVDDDFVKAMDANTDKRGWWVGFEVNDPEVRKRVASGELKMFSIGGTGTREAIADA